MNQLNLVAQTTHIHTQNILIKTLQTTDKTGLKTEFNEVAFSLLQVL